MGRACIQLSGVVAREPRVKEYNGSVVLSFSMASDYGKKGSEVTTWWTVELWRKADQTEAINFLTHAIGKGAKVFATGWPSVRTYTDQQGAERFVAEVKRAEVDVIVAAPREQDVTQAPRPAAPEPELYDSSIPF